MSDAVKKDGDVVSINAKALGLPEAEIKPEHSQSIPGMEPGAVIQEDGRIKIDLSKISFSDEQLKAADAMMVGMFAERPQMAADILNKTADSVAALAPDEMELTTRLRAAAVEAMTPVLPDAEGFMMGSWIEKIKGLGAEMGAFHSEVATIVGSEEILDDLAKGIQAVAHPDTPFVPAKDASPEI